MNSLKTWFTEETEPISFLLFRRQDPTCQFSSSTRWYKDFPFSCLFVSVSREENFMEDRSNQTWLSVFRWQDKSRTATLLTAESRNVLFRDNCCAVSLRGALHVLQLSRHISGSTRRWVNPKRSSRGTTGTSRSWRSPLVWVASRTRCVLQHHPCVPQGARFELNSCDLA